MLFSMAMVVGVTLTLLALLPFIGLFILMVQVFSSTSIHFSFAARARDSQYSDSKLRNAVDQTVIPYPANQKRGVRNILRVDKRFRAHGPEDQKKEYHKRPHMEAVYSFSKNQYRMAINKVRGLSNVASYPLYSLLCLVLNRKATENIGRPDKAIFPTYFNT
jgi:hypothetical protein